MTKILAALCIIFLLTVGTVIAENSLNTTKVIPFGSDVAKVHLKPQHNMTNIAPGDIGGEWIPSI